MTQPASDQFSALDADLILLAAEATGFRSTGRFQQLNSMENRVYAVEVEDETQPKGIGQLIVKFYRPERWTPQMLVSEHALLQILTEEKIETPKLIPLTQMSRVHPASRALDHIILSDEQQPSNQRPTLGQLGPFCFAVWEKVRGRVPLELEEQDLLSIGRTVARMHNLFERKINPDHFSRIQFSLDLYLGQPLKNLMHWNQVPRQFEQPIFELIERLARGLEWLPQADPFLPVHGDLHRLNLVQTTEGGQFWFVDFDDCQLGLAMQDLWPLASTCGVTLPTHMQDIEGMDPSTYALDLLTEGYREFRGLPTDWKVFVEPLRTLKMVHYLGWIAGRWSDPFFRQTFSFFEDTQYWEKTYFELSDQFQLLTQKALLEL